jgi:hypothetical protein
LALPATLKFPDGLVSVGRQQGCFSPRQRLRDLKQLHDIGGRIVRI